MVNGVVIISPEGEVFSKEGLAPGGHGSVIAEYIKDKSLVQKEFIANHNGYTLSLYLSSLDYFVGTVENKKSIFYLGDKIFEGQYQWFQKEKKRLRTTTLGVVEVTNENIFHYDSYTLEQGVTPFSMLKQLIAEKYECREKGQKGREYVSGVRN